MIAMLVVVPVERKLTIFRVAVRVFVDDDKQNKPKYD